MAHDEAIARLKALEDNDDFEYAHGEADDILCKLLRELGYDDVVDAYDLVGKWYA